MGGGWHAGPWWGRLPISLPAPRARCYSPGMPDPDQLAPALARALDRDGITIPEIARIVGLDPRTIRRWGTDDEAGSRAAAFRRLEDWIAGRAQAVLSGDATAWDLRDLSEGVAPADVMRLVEAVRQATARTTAEMHLLQAVGDSLGLLACNPRSAHATADGGVPVAPVMQKTTAGELHSFGAGRSLRVMNPAVAQDVAKSLRDEHRGRMVHFAQKVQPDFQRRLDAAARHYGVKRGDVLRVLVDVLLPEPADVSTAPAEEEGEE